MHDDLAGRTLAGRYDVLAPLGSGGMGSVYRARDRELDEEIALKVIHRDLLDEPTVLERFRREVKLARRVTHRNVARTYELNRAGDIAFCTMELVEGESLRARLQREKQLAPEEAIAIARALCDGLAAAHDVGVIHRDIKPENVLIARDGRVVLADFGVAAATFADSNEVSGTLAYMAPEQSRGEPPTPETDVYALAVVIFEMVSGRVPFRGAPLEVVMAKQETPHLQLEGGSRDLALVVARATALDRSERIRTASQLGQLLGTLASAAPSAPPIGSAAGYEVRTVIVLPPRATASVEYLALALHEAVLARLGRVPRVRAVARTSATAEPAQSVVELVVDEVVSATITRPGGAPLMLRLPIEVGELDATADAIAGLVASTVDQVPAQIAPQDARAIGQMLRARARMQRGFEGAAEIVAMLENANELSPGDPRIVASLAFAEVRCAFFFDEASSDRLARARTLVDRALATGSGLPESHLAAGHLELHTGNSVRAARHFRDAIACGPQVAEAHEHIGRMLLEAGFLDVGLARIEDALAIAPNRGVARWDLARAWALEGRWDDCDRLAADLVAENADRWVTRARFAWWRRDEALLSKVCADTVAGTARRADIPRMFAMIADTILTHSWQDQRDAIVAIATTPTASARRLAFNAQIAAEIAGYFGDTTTCVAMIERAASCGAFDLHWLDRCTLLDVARGPEIAAVREELARRASSILDAMYGDAESIDTVMG